MNHRCTRHHAIDTQHSEVENDARNMKDVLCRGLLSGVYTVYLYSTVYTVLFQKVPAACAFQSLIMSALLCALYLTP